jgi:hypothetical protein
MIGNRKRRREMEGYSLWGIWGKKAGEKSK